MLYYSNHQKFCLGNLKGMKIYIWRGKGPVKSRIPRTIFNSFKINFFKRFSEHGNGNTLHSVYVYNVWAG